jgi:hypothetical protein
VQKNELDPLKSRLARKIARGGFGVVRTEQRSATKAPHEMIVYCDARLNEKIIHAVGVVF